jgi:uncharacterized protein YqeY
MTLTERVKSDLATAMKAGEKERVGTLRLVLSELQKAAKEGSDDELAVLRRERKRRHEAARAFRDGGREDLATAEDSEAELIEAYLPAELSDDELAALVDDAVASTGASSAKDMGAVMKAVMAQVAGRADGRRVSDRVKERLTA